MFEPFGFAFFARLIGSHSFASTDVSFSLRDGFFADVRCSRHAGSVAAHCSKLQCSRRPDRHVGHPLVLFHATKVVTNTLVVCDATSSRQVIRAIGFTPPKQSRLPKLYSHHNHAIGRLCGDVFASDSAAMHTGAGGHANDFMQCVPLSTMGSHANDFMQHLQHRPYSNNLALAPRRQQPIRQGRSHQNQYSTPQHLPRDRFVQQHNTDQIRH